MTSRTPERSASATHKALAADSRLALLDVLEHAEGPLDAVEAGRRVGLHRNTARVHLDQLAEVGLVERQAEHRSTPGRPRVLYATQGASDPPTFTLFATRSLSPQYLRYLERKLRESFDLGPTPVKLRVRLRNE